LNLICVYSYYHSEEFVDKMNQKIKRRSLYFLFFYLTTIFFSSAVSAVSSDVTVEIGIFSNVTRANISGKNDLKVLSKNKTVNFSAGDYSVIATKSGLQIGNKNFGSRVEIISSGYISVNGRGYRGSLILIKKSKYRFTVINRVDLEEYLYGVMCPEISPNWPEETLKAQAVISRTYALKNLTKHSGEGFNLCDRVHCQVYAGLSGENPLTNQTVDTTRGEILIYKNEPIDAFFHSTCGGYTEKPSNVWGSPNDPEYLQGVKCEFCADDPRYYWEHNLTKGQIASVLRKKGYSIKEIKKIEVYKKGNGGRVSKLEIIDGRGKKYILLANQFRLFFNPENQRSTFVEIKTYNDTYQFKGKGWGHGIGLCQWGARGMGLKGYNYRQILEYYYPGTKLKKVK